MVLGLSLREVVVAAPWVWADRPNEKVLVRTWTATGVGVDRLKSLDGVDQGIQDEGMHCLDMDQDVDQNQVIPSADASE